MDHVVHMPRCVGVYLQGSLSVQVSHLSIKYLHTGKNWTSICSTGKQMPLKKKYPHSIDYEYYVYRPLLDRESDHEYGEFVPIDPNQGAQEFKGDTLLRFFLRYNSPNIPAYDLACSIAGRLDIMPIGTEHVPDMVRFEFTSNRFEMAITLFSSLDTLTVTDIGSVHLGSLYTGNNILILVPKECVCKFIEAMNLLRFTGDIDENTTAQFNVYGSNNTAGQVHEVRFHVGNINHPVFRSQNQTYIKRVK